MKLKLKKDDFVNKFLSPISRVGEKCVISLFPDHTQSLVSTSDGNPILYAYLKTNCDLNNKEEVDLNIPNVNKMIRMFNCIDSDELELTVNTNNIEYSSLNMNFKYHLLEDGVIPKTPVTIDKITSLTFDSNFIIEKDKLSEIMKGTTFASESKKIYFYMKDGNVYAELTDKEIANVDSVSYFITNTFSGTEIKKPILIDIEIFKMMLSIKEDITTKINTKNHIMMFRFGNTDYTLQYIVAPLTK